MKIPEFAVRRPVSTLMIFAAITLIGCVAFSKLNLDFLPDIEPPAISVITIYPGASATDVESEVTKYLEDVLSTTPDLDRIESISKDNLSLITCRFKWGCDLDEAANDVREKIDLAKSDIADGAQEPYILKFNSSMVPMTMLMVTAEESAPDLYRIADKQICDPLKRVPGVGAIILAGGEQRQINVHFDRDALEAHRIPVQQVRKVLQAENLDLPVGNIKAGDRDLQIRVVGRLTTVSQIAGLVIGQHDGALIRLEDVATISDAHEDRTMWSWGNNIPDAVGIFIQKQSGANTVNVSKAVMERLNILKAGLPTDVKVIPVVNTSDNIHSMIDNLTEAVCAGGILVIAVCFAFLRRWRPSLIVSLAIPFSILAAFIGMLLMGYTINVISLMSLSIAAGMVVDDAIVVLESIVRKADQGMPPAQAAITGTSEVGLAVTASTLTLVAVFSPLLLIQGIAGILFKQLAFLILVTIMASLFTSLTLTPMGCSRILETRNLSRSNALARLSEKALDAMDRLYTSILESVLAHRVLTLALILAAFLLSLSLIPLIGTEFLPQIDSGDVEVAFELSEGTRDEVTRVRAEEILEIFQREVPEAESSYAMAGRTKDGLLSSMGFREGTNVGHVGVHLIDKDRRSRSAKEIADAIRPLIEALPGIEKVSIRSISATQKILAGGKPISIEILGQNMQDTSETALKVFEIVQRTRGAVDVSTSRGNPRPEIHIHLDRDRAAAMGLNAAMVTDALRTSYYGFDDTKLRDAGDDFIIQLRLQEDQRRSAREIGDTPITTLTGQTVKLSSVSFIEETFGPVEIERKNRERVTRVQAELSGRSLGEVTREIRSRIAAMDIPSGVTIEWGGDVDQQSNAFHDLLLVLVVGILLVYMVMAGQFEDFIDPLIIMFSIPLAFAGVIWAFVLTGTVLNIMSFIGIIMLGGISVKNAIVLVDYTIRLRKRGTELVEAVLNAGRTRLRPVLMTSLTTIFGMVPLALSRGEGSEIWNALGITVIGGLLFSLIVTLVLIPLLYTMIHGRTASEEL